MLQIARNEAIEMHNKRMKLAGTTLYSCGVITVPFITKQPNYYSY